jgi:hypothetical protein
VLYYDRHQSLVFCKIDLHVVRFLIVYFVVPISIVWEYHLLLSIV